VGGGWIEAQWEVGRLRARDGPAVLVLDEIQKVAGWSDAVKNEWDRDTRERRPLKVVILGSAPLLLARGLGESLAGRFELVRVPHWSFPEMREAFGFDLDAFVFYGGYPGAASLIGEPARFRQYILDSLIEPTLARDVLQISRIEKPALLRRVFALACEYSGQILSYQKMVGQLQDAGNTTTIAHYLDLLSAAGFVEGLQKYSGARVRQRGSSPKLQVKNTALLSSVRGLEFVAARAEPATWGRLVESAVGAHLLNTAPEAHASVTWWRDRGQEVDFVVESTNAGSLLAIEVKSGARREALPGLAAFRRHYPESRPLLVGTGGLPLEEFLGAPVASWLRK
jgi:hypothetical protein